jgi:hypothetical protein
MPVETREPPAFCADCLDPDARECARQTGPSGYTYCCSCPCHQREAE